MNWLKQNKFKTLLGIMAFLAFGLGALDSHAMVCLPNGDSNADDVLGNTRIIEKCRIRVKSNHTSTIEVGTLLSYDLTKAGDRQFIEVVTSANEGGHVACVADQEIASGEFGLCLVSGYIATLRFTAAGAGTELATEGERIFLSGDEAGMAAGDNNQTAGTGYWPVGIWLESATATDHLPAIIDLR